MRKTILFCGFVGLMIILSAVPVVSGEHFGFNNINEARVTEGGAILSYSPEGYTDTGCIAIADVQSGRTRIKIGDLLSVNAGLTYLLSAWAKPNYIRNFHGFLIIEWYDELGKAIGSELTSPVYTSSVRPHTYEPVKPLWMNYSVEVQAPDNAQNGQIFVQMSGGGRRGRSSSGVLLVDDISFARTPRIEISTGEPGNLVIEGNPFPLHITVSDVPEEMSNLTLSGGVYDAWGKEIVYDSIVINRWGINEQGSLDDLGRGYYEIRWKLTSGNTLIREGTVSAGIVPDPEERKYADNSPFALDAGFSWFYVNRGDEVLRTAAEAARRTGIKDLRERLMPADVNPAPGEFHWGRYEKAAKAQHAVGMRILEIIHNVPEWLSSAEDGNTNVPPKNLTGIYDLFKQGAKDLGEYIPYWESWNEADIFFFGGRPEELAGLQKAAFLGAIAGNPDVRVTSNSFCTPYKGRSKWFSDGVFENGFHYYFDVFNMHYYGHGEEDNVIEWIQEYRDGTDRFGLTQPWWITEMGTTCFWDSTGSFRFSEIQQAKKLVKAFTYIISEGFEKYYYFYMAEFLESNRDIWGIFRQNLTPKPAFIALANMTNVLDKAEYLGRIEPQIPDAHAYVFHNGHEDVIVAWSDKTQPLDVSEYNLKALDMFGSPVSLDEIGPNPVYILGAEVPDYMLIDMPVEKKVYSRPDVQSLSLVQMVQGVPKEDFPFGDWQRKGPVMIEEGDPLEVKLTLCNFWDEQISVSSSLEVPEGWRFSGEREFITALDPFEERVISTTVIPGFIEKDRDYPVKVISTAPGRKIAPVVMKTRSKNSQPLER